MYNADLLHVVALLLTHCWANGLCMFVVLRFILIYRDNIWFILSLVYWIPLVNDLKFYKTRHWLLVWCFGCILIFCVSLNANNQNHWPLFRILLLGVLQVPRQLRNHHLPGPHPPQAQVGPGWQLQSGWVFALSEPQLLYSNSNF